MSTKNYTGDLSQPPSGWNDSQNTQQSGGKGDGAAYINAGANALDSIMGAISFFTTGQSTQQPVPPPPPPPTKPPLTQRPAFIGAVAVVLVVIIIIVIALAMRRPALAALPPLPA